jgi:hypothetical protein
LNVEIGAQGFQLRLAAQAAGSNPGSLRQGSNAFVLAGTKYVAWILSRRNCGDLKALRKLGGQVLQTMHCQINAARGQCFFNFFGEHSFGANFGEGNVGDFVAGGLDDFNFNFVATLAKQTADVIGLPKRELGTSRPDAETGHQESPSVPLPDWAAFWSFSFS